jgi:hypothetical protein
MRNTEGMRTQSAQRRRRLRRWVAGPALGLVCSLLLFAAALVGYAVTRWRRRRGALEAASEPVSLAAGDDSARIARENGLTQMLRRVTETGDTRSERVATPTQTARTRALGYTTFPERKRAVSPEGR